MRRLSRPALLLLLVAAVTLPPSPTKQRSIQQRSGRRGSPAIRSGLRFLQASLRPKAQRSTLRAAFERIRFEAAAIVHNGQKLRDEGKLRRGRGRVPKGAGHRSFPVHRQAGTQPHTENDQRPAEIRRLRPPEFHWPGAPRPRSRRSRGTRPHLQRSCHRSKCSPPSRTWSTALSDNWPESTSIRPRLHSPRHQRRPERRLPRRRARNHRARIQDFLASRNAQHHLRSARTIPPSAKNWNRASSRLSILPISPSPPNCRTW